MMKPISQIVKTALLSTGACALLLSSCKKEEHKPSLSSEAIILEIKIGGKSITPPRPNDQNSENNPLAVLVSVPEGTQFPITVRTDTAFTISQGAALVNGLGDKQESIELDLNTPNTLIVQAADQTTKKHYALTIRLPRPTLQPTKSAVMGFGHARTFRDNIITYTLGLVAVKIGTPQGETDGSTPDHAIPMVMSFGITPNPIDSAMLSMYPSVVPHGFELATSTAENPTVYHTGRSGGIKEGRTFLGRVYDIAPLNFGHLTKGEAAKDVLSGIKYLVLQPKQNPSDDNRRFYVLKGKRGLD